MALPNPGAEAIRDGKKLIAKAEQHEAEVRPAMSVEERNAIFDEHEEAIKSFTQFKKGDVVKASPMAMALAVDFPLLPEQKAFVLKAGKEVIDMVGDPFADVLLNTIDDEGKIVRTVVNNRFLVKI